ncbi:MAG: fumarylacetoacetate hydrolase family protein [Alphaproteobacteria bacterium]|jgi:2-keto-4-pentenoate hydratase/2-oxohepta-3-ene-1,7-dioic acid hydratase in catechol pathway|nr:fumarylacetoacetate hydrolase family protein [Alphaproteobacteria bacterium]
MRWLRYEYQGETSYGLVEGDEVQPVRGTPFDDFEASGRRLAMDAVKVLIPVEPRTFYAVGLNYIKHISEAAELLGTTVDVPANADIGYRAVNALVADGEAIVIPKDASEKVQYEGELVVVIGRRAKGLSEAEALDCVLGYTIGNDVSERTWQASDRTLWRAKNTDTFKPMGPWIETEVDLDALRTTVRVNGEVKCAFATNEMIFSVATFIARMSRYLTLYPGDVVWMGADGPTENIKAGDTVAVEIDGIGVLTNPVVAAS